MSLFHQAFENASSTDARGGCSGNTCGSRSSSSSSGGGAGAGENTVTCNGGWGAAGGDLNGSQTEESRDSCNLSISF